MNKLEKAMEITRKTLNVFLMIDTSGSMEGTKMPAVNEAIREVLPEMTKIAQNNENSSIKVAMQTFSNGSQWLTEQPVEVENFLFTNLSASGATDMGEAFKKLKLKLESDVMKKDEKGVCNPVFILISDGYPSDNDWQRQLELLYQNSFFKRGIRVAVGVEDADMSVLEKFAGFKENTIYIHEREKLKNAIRFVTRSATSIGSRSINNISSSPDQVNKAVGEEIKQQIQMYEDEMLVDQESWD